MFKVSIGVVYGGDVEPENTIRRLLAEGQFAISRRHIEDERPWRGILVSHVHQALTNGQLHRHRNGEAWWLGKDINERELEVFLQAVSTGFKREKSWEQAEMVLIKTAYIPDGKENDWKRRVIFAVKRYFKRRFGNG